MNSTISFYTFGCRLNQAETAILQRSLEKKGYQVVDYRQPADVVVVNTCTVTENGDTDTRKLVNKINRINPQVRIALLGCQSQIQREQLLKLPNVKWVVGNSRKMEFGDILSSDEQPLQPKVITPVISRKSFKIKTAGIDRQHTRANLKIQDGCDFFCSFCVIPYARGRARSREFHDIMKEAAELISAGHQELVLTGINIGTYKDDKYSLKQVVRRLLQLPGLLRLRLSSIEPTTIPEGLIELFENNTQLCRYLHIPLQSGSETILKSMNRKYAVNEFSDFIHLLYQRIPGICLGTDVMVGFPGETEEHFEQTYKLLQSLPLAYFHVFSYSERPWAKSRKLNHQVPREIIEERSRKLRELSTRKRHDYMNRQIGTVQNILFEQQKDGWWSGLTDTYIRVKVKSENDLQNQFLTVKLQQVENQYMIGTFVNKNR
jgi:threonylcarbamoyladenosine tRNA methylthiotransferase MtaB